MYQNFGESSGNKMLLLGLGIIILGLALLIYSLTYYAEVKSLESKIDFEELDNSNQISTSDKYYKYLTYSDYLNQVLNKNKNILLKNVSCVYLDYAQHNTLALYKLIFKGASDDTQRRGVVEGNIRSLSNMLDNYGICKQTPKYKEELKNILDDIRKTEDFKDSHSVNMENFLNKPQNIEQIEEVPFEPEVDAEFENNVPELEPNAGN
ncbi:hypothetical protein J6G99_06235 [bacterium]|nr:hypothetical protein [bacterium]